MHRYFTGGLVLLVIVVAIPTTESAAQAPASTPAAAPTATTSLAPTIAATHLSFSTEDQQALTISTSAGRMGPNEGKAAAIVGGAVVITGLVVGGDGGTLLIVGGAGLGLFGLYIWQRGD